MGNGLQRKLPGQIFAADLTSSGESFEPRLFLAQFHPHRTVEDVLIRGHLSSLNLLILFAAVTNGYLVRPWGLDLTS